MTIYTKNGSSPYGFEKEKNALYQHYVYDVCDNVCGTYDLVFYRIDVSQKASIDSKKEKKILRFENLEKLINESDRMCVRTPNRQKNIWYTP